MKRYFAIGLIFALLCVAVSGCASDLPPAAQQQEQPTDSQQETTQQAAPIQPDENMFTDRDRRTDYAANSVRITLSGNTATATANTVQITGSTVTISKEGTYILSGTLEDGSVIIDSGENDKLQLVFDNVSIHSQNAAALYIKEADKVFVTLAEGTENSLSGSQGFSEDGVDGALFSKQDLTVNGSGALQINSPNGHGIVCKDDLVLTGGSFDIQAASHGLDVNDSVRITGETVLNVTAGKDGIHCENSDDAAKGFVYVESGELKLQAEGDGISAGAYARILGGSFDILAGGGYVNGTKESSVSFGGSPGFGGGGRPGNRRTAEQTATEDSTSMKGLKAAGEITVENGSFTMDTADDAIHSDTTIQIHSGSFHLKSGDDACHAEETLTVIGGSWNIETSYEGLEALKVYVQGGTWEIHATDDGINAAGGKDASGSGGRDGMFGGRPSGFGGSSDGVIDLSGGQWRIYSGGDAMDANGSIAISGGDFYVTNPTSGDTSVLDCDTGAVITGGTFFGAGASTMMAHSFKRSSTQGVIACTVGSQSAGQAVTVANAAGEILLSYETEYPCVLLILSSPDLIKGETYTLTVGETTGDIQAN